MNRWHPYTGQVLAWVDFEQTYLNPPKQAASEHDANIATSLVEDDGRRIVDGKVAKQMHKVVIDIDLPVALLESSTPGHFHLFIDKAMTWEQYKDLLQTLASVGIIEHNYVNATIDRGFSAVRLPWVKK